MSGTELFVPLARESADETTPQEGKKINVSLTVLFCALFLLLAILLGVSTTYNVKEFSMITSGRYAMVQDVFSMVFLGFGALMCFLYKNTFTATGHVLCVGSFAFLWSIICRGFFGQVIENETLHMIPIGLLQIVDSLFCAAAVMISMGSIIGRATIAQMLVMTFVEVPLYAINESILMKRLFVADVAGTLIIHLFGLVFGLSLSFVLGKVHDHVNQDRSKNRSSKMSDTIAMIGTFVLFLFWPSFLVAVSSFGHAVTHQRALANAYIGMTGGAFTAFLVTQLFYGGKFRMVEIQNSTLAGGVALGCVVDMMLYPFGAFLTAALAVIVSVLSYKYLVPWLEDRFGLLDTCGTLALHGMPALVGSLVSVIAASQASQERYDDHIGDVFVGMDTHVDVFNVTNPGRTAGTQAGYQLVGIIVTIIFGLCGGTLTGLLTTLQTPIAVMYDDAEEYIVTEDPECETCPCGRSQKKGSNYIEREQEEEEEEPSTRKKSQQKKREQQGENENHHYINNSDDMNQLQQPVSSSKQSSSSSKRSRSKRSAQQDENEDASMMETVKN